MHRGSCRARLRLRKGFSRPTAWVMFRRRARWRRQWSGLRRAKRSSRLEIADLCKPENAKSYVYPIAIFLPGTQKEGWGDEGQGVACRSCFDSADTHRNVVPFLRSYADKTKA